MPFLQQGAASAPIVIPAAQSIRVSALRGSTAAIAIPSGLPGGPGAIVTDTSVVYGPFPAGATVTVSSIIGDCEYVVGTTPVATDGNYNAASVAITGGNMTTVAINASSVGLTTQAAARVTNLGIGYTDGGAAVGSPAAAVTVNTGRGRATIPISATSLVVSCSICLATSMVAATLRGIDGTLTRITSVVPGAATFTINFDGAATAGAVASVDWAVLLV